MSLNDPLANALSKILNAEKVGMSSVKIKPASKMIKTILLKMNELGYIGSYKEVVDRRGNFLVINLLGKINNCNVVKPRYSTKKDDLEKFEKRFLPSKEFGDIFISTQKGILVHRQAKELGLGGRLIAFVY